MLYRYSAKIASSGRVVRAQVNATSVEQAYDILEKKGLINIKVDNNKKHDIVIRELIKKKLSLADVAYITRTLAVSLNAGLPLSRSLNMLIQINPQGLRSQRLREVVSAISDGKTLSSALYKREKEYGSLTCALVSAGEKSGHLERSLNQAADIAEFNVEIRRQIRAALSYPATVLVIALAILVGILTFVVPNLRDSFANIGATELPTITKVVLGVSSAVVKSLWYPVGDSGLGIPILPFIVTLLVYLGIRMVRTPKVRYNWDRIKIKMPVLGPVFHDSALARISTTIAELLDSGIQMPEIIALAAKTSSNKFLESELLDVQNSVIDGTPLSEALNPDVFSPLMIQLISVGESTGEISTLMRNYVGVLDKEIKVKIVQLESKLQPIALVFAGIVIGIIAAAVFAPMYNYVNTIS